MERTGPASLSRRIEPSGCSTIRLGFSLPGVTATRIVKPGMRSATDSEATWRSRVDRRTSPRCQSPGDGEARPQRPRSTSRSFSTIRAFQRAGGLRGKTNGLGLLMPSLGYPPPRHGEPRPGGRERTASATAWARHRLRGLDLLECFVQACRPGSGSRPACRKSDRVPPRDLDGVVDQLEASAASGGSRERQDQARLFRTRCRWGSRRGPVGSCHGLVELVVQARRAPAALAFSPAASGRFLSAVSTQDTRTRLLSGFTSADGEAWTARTPRRRPRGAARSVQARSSPHGFAGFVLAWRRRLRARSSTLGLGGVAGGEGLEGLLGPGGEAVAARAGCRPRRSGPGTFRPRSSSSARSGLARLCGRSRNRTSSSSRPRPAASTCFRTMRADAPPRRPGYGRSGSRCSRARASGVFAFRARRPRDLLLVPIFPPFLEVRGRPAGGDRSRRGARPSQLLEHRDRLGPAARPHGEDPDPELPIFQAARVLFLGSPRPAECLIQVGQQPGPQVQERPGPARPDPVLAVSRGEPLEPVKCLSRLPEPALTEVVAARGSGARRGPSSRPGPTLRYKASARARCRCPTSRGPASGRIG